MDLIKQFVDLDPRTLLAVLAWLNLTLVIVNFGYQATYSDRVKYEPLKLFVISKFFQMLAFFLIGGRGLLPGLLTNYLSNPLFFIAMYAEARFIYELMGRKSAAASKMLAAFVVLGIIAYLWVEHQYHEPSYRIVFACIPYICITAVPTFLLLFGRGNDHFTRLLGAFYLVFCCTQIGRVYTALSNRGMTVFTSDLIQSAGFLTQILLNVLSAAVLFIALKKNLDETNRLRELELVESARTAEKANRMKSQFLATVSHEIRTPLNAILGFTELSRAELAKAGSTRDSARTRERLGQINASAQDLLSIINDILDISKAESGNVQLEKIPFRISEITAACQAAIKPRALEKSLTLAIETPGLEDARLLGDPLRLRQVLMNLLSNAVKFTSAGGVRLTVSTVAAAPADPGNSTRLRFAVRDTGLGVTPEQSARIFQPFVQADRSAARKYGGTGLGLAISKSIVELMGGTIALRSVPGVGSEFSFVVLFERAPEESV